MRLEDSILGLSDEQIYKDYSAISYYVEAYAFTKWARENLGDIEIDGENIFDVSKDNNPEDKNSLIATEKKQVMKENIVTSLDVAISNCVYEYTLPELTDSDWEQVFSNISMITFFQGVSIGLKEYNDYSIATSTTNKEYVDPNELYFSGDDTYYHRVYCTEQKEGTTLGTGYRSVEYITKEYESSLSGETKHYYYYMHDNYDPADKTSELACYYCIENRAKYNKNTSKGADTKAYDEALARERYYQKEDLQGLLSITYHANLEVEGEVAGVYDIPEPQFVIMGNTTQVSTTKPYATTNNQYIRYLFNGWAFDPDSTTINYERGDNITVNENINLYAVWTIQLSGLYWKKDFRFAGTYNGSSGALNSDGTINTSNRGVGDSISYIHIDENENDKSRVQMIGNNRYKGKGAAWTTFSSDFLDIQEFAFDYYLNAGHSFQAGGFIFNIVDSNPSDEHSGTLEGYMISINFNFEMLGYANKQNGAIFKFTYNKGKNLEIFKAADLTLVKSFVLGRYDTSRHSNGEGNLKVRVTDDTYYVSGSQIKDGSGNNYELPLYVGKENMNPNTFGFFSVHFGSEHGHTCNDIGHFKLDNVQVTVVRER